MPVIKPAATGAPEANAMPMHSGSATKNTTIDDSASRVQFADVVDEVDAESADDSSDIDFSIESKELGPSIIRSFTCGKD